MTGEVSRLVRASLPPFGLVGRVDAVNATGPGVPAGPNQVRQRVPLAEHAAGQARSLAPSAALLPSLRCQVSSPAPSLPQVYLDLQYWASSTSDDGQTRWSYVTRREACDRPWPTFPPSWFQVQAANAAGTSPLSAPFVFAFPNG